MFNDSSGSGPRWKAAPASVPFVDLYSPLNFMVTLHTAMMGTSPNFAEQFDANARLLRQLAGQLVETVLAEKSSMFGRRRRHAAGAGVATGFASARAAIGLPPANRRATRSAATGSSRTALDTRLPVARRQTPPTSMNSRADDGVTG